MISTPYPQNERLVLFWHNHFSTSFSAINNQGISIARQHMMLREHGIGNLRTLLKSIIRDPAMLNYLDNNVSRKAKPNENLARELLEIFTLGEGNYTEQDIKNAARALTGYSYSEVYNQQFVFKYLEHDVGEKTIFGRTGNYNGDDLVDLILEQPAAARFIAAKLWRTLIGDISTDSDKLTQHAHAFRQSDYDIKTLYQSLLISDDFWHSDNRAALIQSPVSLTVGTIRSTGLLPIDWQALPSQLAQMGQHLFEPPNVAGWPGEEAWIAPGRLLSRLEWLANLSSNTVGEADSDSLMRTSPVMSAEPSDRPDEKTVMKQSDKETTDYRDITSNLMDSMFSIKSTQLIARMASEEFDVPVRYRITLYGNSGVVWDSEENELIGGHDTKRMGRINRKQLTWQLISFPVSVNVDDVKAVEVEFLNNAATPTGADRNLYVSRVSFGNRNWSSSEGKQTSKCARKKPQQQGNLYCNGKVRMEKYSDVREQNIKPVSSDALRVSGVYLNHIRNPNRKPYGEIAFALSDVEFNDRYWNTMTVKYVKDRDGYSILVNKEFCWPACFLEWPECSRTNEHSPQSRTVSLPLASNSESFSCTYDDLQQPDKQLAKALWMAVDDLYTAGMNSNKISLMNDLYAKWKPHISAMHSQLEKSRYSNDKIKLKIVPRPVKRRILERKLSAPLPAGISAEKRQTAWKELQQNMPDINLVTLLLPAAPTQSFKTAHPELNEIVIDLVYQLR